MGVFHPGTHQTMCGGFDNLQLGDDPVANALDNSNLAPHPFGKAPIFPLLNLQINLDQPNQESALVAVLVPAQVKPVVAV